MPQRGTPASWCVDLRTFRERRALTAAAWASLVADDGIAQQDQDNDGGGNARLWSLTRTEEKTRLRRKRSRHMLEHKLPNVIRSMARYSALAAALVIGDESCRNETDLRCSGRSASKSSIIDTRAETAGNLNTALRLSPPARWAISCKAAHWLAAW